MGEIFQVIFNSIGKNVVNNTNKASVIYNVNWTAILPTKYKHFKCNYIFKSEDYNGGLDMIVFVDMDIGRTNNFDGLSQTNNIGIIYHSFDYSMNISMFTASSNDNNSFYMNYPTFNNVTLNLRTIDDAILTDMVNYVLILSL